MSETSEKAEPHTLAEVDADNVIDSAQEYLSSAARLVAPIAEPLLMVLGGRERREREIMELMLNRAKLDIINGGVNRGYGAGYPMMGGYGGMGYGGYGMGGYGMTASPHVGNPYAANAWARAQPVYCGQREANG